MPTFLPQAEESEGMKLGTIVWLGLALAGFVAGAVVLGARSGGPAPGDPEAAYPDEPTSPESPPVVQTVRPRQDTSLAISVEEPADVDGFYRADLEARVAGPVKKVTKG